MPNLLLLSANQYPMIECIAVSIGVSAETENSCCSQWLSPDTLQPWRTWLAPDSPLSVPEYPGSTRVPQLAHKAQIRIFSVRVSGTHINCWTRWPLSNHLRWFVPPISVTEKEKGLSVLGKLKEEPTLDCSTNIPLSLVSLRPMWVGRDAKEVSEESARTYKSLFLLKTRKGCCESFNLTLFLFLPAGLVQCSCSHIDSLAWTRSALKDWNIVIV